MTSQKTEPDLFISVGESSVTVWGTGTLAAAVLGGVVCGLSPLGGGHSYWRKTIPRGSPTVVTSQQIIPREFDFGGQWDLIVIKVL